MSARTNRASVSAVASSTAAATAAAVRKPRMSPSPHVTDAAADDDA